MRISDWSSDVCSSDLAAPAMAARAPTGRTSRAGGRRNRRTRHRGARKSGRSPPAYGMAARMAKAGSEDKPAKKAKAKTGTKKAPARPYERPRSEEHTSELQSLMRSSYDVFCLKKKKDNT